MEGAREFIPYGRQWIERRDIDAVVEVLESDWLTTGPQVAAFEEALAEFCGVPHAIAVSSGTAALHLAMLSLGVGPGDEVIVPAMTFVATANAVVFTGATPVFADICEDTLLLDPDSVSSLLSSRTKGIVAVDYGGHPCDYEALQNIASRHGLFLVSDACHSLGGYYKGRPVGTLADVTVFSFHPVKMITTGEGGALVCADSGLAKRARRLRNHGIDLDFRERAGRNTWEYDMVELGFNYRITDFQCALGISQLSRLKEWVVRRNEIASRYRSAFCDMKGITPLVSYSHVVNAYHLFVVKLIGAEERLEFFLAMRRRGIGVNVHYKPVHLHSFYRERFGGRKGQCPVAEKAYHSIVSLPIYPQMSAQEVDRVIGAAAESLEEIGVTS